MIPAFDAERTLAKVVRRIPRGLPLHGIVVVNDGSRDATSEVARELAADDSRLQLVDLPHNVGYGGAVKHGLRRLLELDVDVVACLHADGQYAPEELPTLLAELRRRELDLLQGSRMARGTALVGGMPVYKYVAGRMLTALENRVLGLRMTDYHSGYVLFGRRALTRVPFLRLSDSFDFDLEMIAAARAVGLAVGEHPIPTHYGDEVSHLKLVPYGLRVLRVMFNYVTGHYHRLERADRFQANGGERA